MKKKGFTIQELKVKSFVTQITETEQRTTKGGDVMFRLYPIFDIWTVEKSQFATPGKMINSRQLENNPTWIRERFGD